MVPAPLRRTPLEDVHRALGAKMGAFVNPHWVSALAWSVAIVIAGLNVWLLAQTFAAL